jgi:hypothetical protein
VEAWISLGEYPWNWCPILTAESDEVKGYRLMVGPLGQASLECAIGNQWIACTTGRDALPLRTWVHVAGVYRADSGLTIYLNGEPAATQAVKGAITFAPRTGYVLGMVARPEKPDIHRIMGRWPPVRARRIVDEVSLRRGPAGRRIKAEFAAVARPLIRAPEAARGRLQSRAVRGVHHEAQAPSGWITSGWSTRTPTSVCFKIPRSGSSLARHIYSPA